jgi:tetratricopeptide (TPR) repeat protein
MHTEIDAVLLDALERPAAERESFVDSACGTDAAAKARLRRLLREVDENDPFLSPGGAVEGAFGDDLADALARDEGVPLGDRIGPYRIVSELGRGGMAVVYLAERVDGAFGQQVALKVVKRGIDTDEVLTRFRQERQILASLNHPGIARLLDGGETPDGRPYLVMELVKGEPIDRYCERAALGVDARVDLCIAVARAVQHAHRHLVVHRDLKPSNILITAEGEIRLLDFGIAKLLETSPVEYAAPPTRTALRVMTPEYASPEQVRGEPITTGSDVYQLGLILFELLTGRRAQVFDGHRAAEVDAIVLHEPAPRPSAVEGTAHLARLRQLRGDLDNIVLTALNKEPERRYGSVDHFVDDLVRYRTGLPVAARGDSFRYRAGKFLRRHRHAAAAAAAVVFLVATIVTFYSVRLASERDRARRDAATATEVANFVGGLFQAADPIRSAGADVTARELLERGAARLDSELSDQPDVQVRLMSLIGRIYRSIGLLPEAISLHEKALANRRERLGPDHPEVGLSLANLGMVLYLTGRFDEARQRLEEALSIQEAALGPTHADLAETLNSLGLLQRRTGRSEVAKDLFERALAIRERAWGAKHQDIGPIANNLGLAYLDLDAYARAAEYFERSLSINERAFGPDSPTVAGNLANLGDTFRQSGELEKARPLLERAVAGQKKAHGADHRDLATALNSLALLLTDMKLYAEAIPLYERAQRVYERALGPDHAYTAYPIENLGDIYRAMGDYGRAQTQYERALEIRVGAFGEVHRNVAQTLERLGTLRVLMDDCRGATPLLQRARDVTRETRSADHSSVGTSSLGLGSCAVQAGRHAEAEPLLLEAYRILRKEGGSDDENTMMAAKYLAELYDVLGKPDEAARYRAGLRRRTQ